MEQDNSVGCRCEEEWETPNGGKGLMVQGGWYKDGKKWDVSKPNSCICFYFLEYSLAYNGIVDTPFCPLSTCF